jgi:hypothetical protein
MKRLVLGMCLTLGCRIGGGSGANADMASHATPDAGMNRAVAPSVDVPERRDASTPTTDAKAIDQPVACTPPAVSVCNPVTNTGCADAAMQCDADLDQTVLAGRCVLSTPLDESGDLCLGTFISQSCNPKSTCSDQGNCRQLCFCDSACEPGKCCSELLGTLGFMLCAGC